MPITNGTDHMTKAEFLMVFEALAPGGTIVYARGSIVRSRITCFDDSTELNALAEAAIELSKDKLAFLTRRRIVGGDDIDRWEYRATKAKWVAR